jgi:predicted P-loop ATPase
MLFKNREYNPILELIDGVQWDGENRIENCLTRWMKAEDSPYTREVSRLIFAGGINRLYNPGCKFDDVPVLVGTKQGEGKSTFIRWLAINEVWFTEIKKVDGSDSIEQLFGAWVCEIPELSAFKKADDVESIKAYVTRTKDKYRKPYDKSPVEYPRRCIFVGTTNNDRFLTDKTGNRRFYPVTARSSGYDLFDHEKECKEYIIQCWAEAKERYKKGEMPPFADYHLLKEYQAKQEEAMEDDWRVGKIVSYLDHFVPGQKLCAIRIYKECLYPDSSSAPKPYESREIGQIMAKMEGWEKCKSRFYDEKYGQQRGWEKKENATVSDPNELPF